MKDIFGFSSEEELEIIFPLSTGINRERVFWMIMDLQQQHYNALIVSIFHEVMYVFKVIWKC